MANKIETTEYYSGKAKCCQRTHKIELCHQGNGNAGYVCKYFVDFYCGDKSFVICSYGVPKEQTLFDLELF